MPSASSPVRLRSGDPLVSPRPVREIAAALAEFSADREAAPGFKLSALFAVIFIDNILDKHNSIKMIFQKVFDILPRFMPF